MNPIVLNWLIKQKIEVAKLPEVSQVIEFKKKRLVTNTQEFIDAKQGEKYFELAKKLLELGEAHEVLAALIKEGYGNEFSETHYNMIREDSRPANNPNGTKRLFVAKGKLDNLTPGTLIKFLEREVEAKIGDVGQIEIMNEFSFINVTQSDAELILAIFKQKNSRKPLVVEAKSRDGGSRGGRSGGGFNRGGNRSGWGGFRGGSSRDGGSSRGGYRGGSSRDGGSSRGGDRRSGGSRY